MAQQEEVQQVMAEAQVVDLAQQQEQQTKAAVVVAEMGEMLLVDLEQPEGPEL